MQHPPLLPYKITYFMLKVAVSFIIFAMAYSTVYGQGSTMKSIDMTEFQWKNRLLLIFAPDRKHPIFANMHKSIASKQVDVVDRDLVVFEIFESGSSFIGADMLDTTQADSLRKKFAAPPGKFTAILIGKDGGIKLRTEDKDTQLEEIFALIDSMPMRQSEMRRK